MFTGCSCVMLQQSAANYSMFWGCIIKALRKYDTFALKMTENKTFVQLQCSKNSIRAFPFEILRRDRGETKN